MEAVGMKGNLEEVLENLVSWNNGEEKRKEDKWEHMFRRCGKNSKGIKSWIKRTGERNETWMVDAEQEKQQGVWLMSK